MAIPRVLCRARFILNNDIFGFNKFTPLINSAPLTKVAHIQVFRPFRTNFSVNLVTKEKDEKDKNKQLASSMSSSSSSDSDADSDLEDEVTIEIHKGLPRITVPLPSRKENCSFTLKPISNTVGDFIEMLKKEDRGIDRVACKTKEGTRIASSNTIETLLEEDFKLVINDCTYNVNTPKDERLTQEEVQSLHDIKTLVHKLYEQLNVQEHQLSKERELVMELEALKQEVLPLEEARNQIEVVAHKRSNWLAWAGLGLMSVQFGILARLTWWEYSWDIMEPVTYFVTYGTAMAAYSYFVLTKEEYVLTEVRDRQHLLIMHKKAKKVGVDLTRYNQIKDQIHKVEYKLKKLRNPLKLHLPKNGKTGIAVAAATAVETPGATQLAEAAATPADAIQTETPTVASISGDSKTTVKEKDSKVTE